MAAAVDKIGLGWFAFLIKIGAIMGLSSVMLVLVYGQTRIFYIMSSDGLLPPAFHKVHEKFRTPYINTIFVGAVIAIVAGLTPIGVLGDLVSLGTMTAFMIVCFSVLYLRHKQPDVVRPFRTPFVPLVPICGMLASGYLIYGMLSSAQGGEIFYRLQIFFIAGVLVYFLYGQFHSKLAIAHKKSYLGVEEEQR
jgi:APA family basic amino acid/polyamine antiporter